MGSVNMNARTAILAAACGLTAMPALGQTGKIRIQSRQGALNGGVFNVVDADASDGYDFGSFQTFCVELNEFLDVPGTYDATINTRAIGGGLGGQDGSGGDPLGTATAKLYLAFLNGDLGDASIGSLNTDQTNGAVQLAIWALEDEAEYDNARFERFGTDTAITPDATLIAAALALFNYAQTGGWSYSNVGDVRILNLIQSGNVKQDLLYLIPLPQAGAIAGLGLAGVAIRRRR
jgi:hypothetical protein